MHHFVDPIYPLAQLELDSTAALYWSMSETRPTILAVISIKWNLQRTPFTTIILF